MKKGCLITVIALLIVVLVLILIGYISNRPIPIPKEKESFIGIWKSSSGFKIEIKPNGLATILQTSDISNPDYNPKFGWLPGRKPRVIFKGDSLLNLYDPYNLFRSYKINQLPYMDSSAFKMILEGDTLTKYFPHGYDRN